MLLREDARGVLAIGQQSHAWLSGQLARAWGNERFGRVEPLEQVCLAAEQHDAGWTARDLEPLHNPETGLPRSFMEMPLEEHLRIWTQGPQHLLSQSGYAALLVSLHGWRLYERRDLPRMPVAEAEAISSFLASQRKFQSALVDALGADEHLLERNSLLIWTWDYLSLAVCLNWGQATAEDCPTADGPVDIELTGREAGWLIEPWPFSAPSLTVRCEGRRLGSRFADEHEMRQGLADAPWEMLEVRLESTGG